MIKNKNILVLGMARSGYCVAKLLANDNNIIVTDSKEQNSEHVNELESLGVKVEITNDPLKLLDGIDIVVKNPGIIKEHPVVVSAKENSIKVINEVEVAYGYLPNDVYIIGITGSNGKTTTTTIIYESLKRILPNVHLAGNIGIPLSSVVLNINSGDILVIEISDHQLVDMYDFKTDISVLTNLTPVHLDFHKDYETYKMVKKKIFNHHTSSDIAIINSLNDDSINLCDDIISNKLFFNSSSKSDAYYLSGNFYLDDRLLFNIDDFKIRGIHNYENILCAILVFKSLNIDTKYIIEFLTHFNGVEHRIEFVRDINGVKYYNDSKSTNTESTITALKTFDKNVILILGGLDRNHSFEPLLEYLSSVKRVIAFGECRNRIAKWASEVNLKCDIAVDIADAVFKSHKFSEIDEVVLLSPACASWDQYNSFEERGNDFKNCVNKL